MSDLVLIAIIGFVQAVTLAILGPMLVRLGKVRRDTSAVRDQVVNDHIDADGKPIIMRDENDRRHAETGRWFAELRRDIGGLRSDVRAVSERVQVLEELEITTPRKRKQ